MPLDNTNSETTYNRIIQSWHKHISTSRCARYQLNYYKLVRTRIPPNIGRHTARASLIPKLICASLRACKPLKVAPTRASARAKALAGTGCHWCHAQGFLAFHADHGPRQRAEAQQGARALHMRATHLHGRAQYSQRAQTCAHAHSYTQQMRLSPLRLQLPKVPYLLCLHLRSAALSGAPFAPNGRAK